MEERCEIAYNFFVETVEKEMRHYIDNMCYRDIEKAAQLIVEGEGSGNRVHISGIGKPGHVSGYISSLLSSTGTPAYFLNGTEAVHGSCGQLKPGDTVIFISNSGETSEMRSTVSAVKNNGCRVIGVSGNPESWLANNSDVHLFAGIKHEGGPLGRAPRVSILAEILILQALSVVLQEYHKITPLQYIKWHPGGVLGKLQENER